MCPDTSGVAFEKLRELDMFAIEFQFLHDMLVACTQIRVFKVFSLKGGKLSRRSSHPADNLEIGNVFSQLQNLKSITSHLIHFLVLDS